MLNKTEQFKKQIKENIEHKKAIQTQIKENLDKKEYNMILVESFLKQLNDRSINSYDKKTIEKKYWYLVSKNKNIDLQVRYLNNSFNIIEDQNLILKVELL